uniref:Denticleless E3 ubiquitin protein ligase homolog (Drosophila) n=1 Tax=Fundulus heteroclitus TaxID=8078 RepID=A0A3Q2R3U3_FUNHE
MFFRSIVDRGVDPCSRIPLSSLLEGYQCVRHDEHVSFGTMGDSVPPFGLAFSSAGDMHHVLAAANEEGAFKEWLAHENAVFDIAWVPGESHLTPVIYRTDFFFFFYIC